MELKERFCILKRRLILIIIITLTTTLSAGILSHFLTKPQYKADISVVIGKTQSAINNSNSMYYDIMLYQTMVLTYSQLTKSRIVLDNVIKELSLKTPNLQSMKASELLSMITVTSDKDTRFLTISVTANDPKEAVNIANQFAKSLKVVGKQINKVDIVMIIDKAELPITDDSPKASRNIAMGVFIGIVFSIGLVFLLEYLDNTIKTKEDVETVTGLHVIGTISLIKIKDKDAMMY